MYNESKPPNGKIFFHFRRDHRVSPKNSMDRWNQKNWYIHWNCVDIASGSGDTTAFKLDYMKGLTISCFATAILDYWMKDVPEVLPFHSPNHEMLIP
jgi:hypothetical protein